MELSNRLKAKKQAESEVQTADEDDMNYDYEQSSNNMQIDEVARVKKTKQSKCKKSVNASEKDYLEIVKLLLEER